MNRIDLSTIFITHDIDEALVLSDRIYVMTGRPGVIDHELVIRTPRSARRGYDLTEEFLQYKKEILRILK